MPELLQLLRQLDGACGPLLRAAASQGQANLITLLLRLTTSPQQLVLQADEESGETALVAAVRNRQPAAAEALLACVPDQQLAVTVGSSGSTPLHLAVSSNSLVVAHALLNHCSQEQILRRDRQGNTPLQHALKFKACSKAMVQLLLQHHPEQQVMAENDDKQIPISWAARHNWVGVMRLLLAHSPHNQVLHRDVRGNTALAVATWFGCAQAVELLLVYSPDLQVMQEFEHGRSALMVAATQGDKEVVRALLAHCPKEQVLHALPNGTTPPMQAAAQGNAAALQLMLPYLMDSSVQALNAALAAIKTERLTKGHKRCCLLLVARGASLAVLPEGQRKRIKAALRDKRLQVPNSMRQDVRDALVCLATSVGTQTAP